MDWNWVEENRLVYDNEHPIQWVGEASNGKSTISAAIHGVLDTVDQINDHNGLKDHTITGIAINNIPATEHTFEQRSNGDMLATRYARYMTIKDM